MANLSIQRLSKSFGATSVLSGVDLNVPSGSLAAILGPSGSGKTTLLRLVCGFERANSGSIQVDQTVFNAPGRHLPCEQRQIGYVPQEGALFPHLSVAENIVFGLPRRQRKARYRVDELLELVGLPTSFGARAPQSLSGGQQQRVALARALAPAPTLVLLDEPFSSLDAALRVETRQAVAAALAACGATALLVTHDQSEALSLGQQVAVLLHGRLIQVDTPQQLYCRPVSAQLASFIGDAVLLPGSASNGSVQCALGRLPLARDMPEGQVEVLLRPEQLRLQPIGMDGTAARIVDADYFGHDTCVHLKLESGGDSVTRLTARIPGQLLQAIGERVSILVEGAVVTYAC